MLLFTDTYDFQLTSFINCRYRIHIIDLDPSSVTSSGWLEDTSLVEKYKISDEAYDKLDGNFFDDNLILHEMFVILYIYGKLICRYV